MRSVTYSMSTSLDGYISGPDGTFNWSVPDQEIFDLATDEVRGLSAHLLGRQLYQDMLFWEERTEVPDSPYPTRDFALAWRA